MKIAYLYDCIYPYKVGGIERRVWELSRRLSKRGHEVHLIGMKFWEGKDTIERDGVILHGVCPVGTLYSDGKRSIWPSLSYGYHILPSLLSEEFDLIDAQLFPYLHCFPAKCISVLKKTPLIITWHEVWGDYWYKYLGPWGWFGKTIEREVSHLSQNLVAVSASTASHLHSIGYNGDITIIPNGIDYNHIDTIPPSTFTTDVIFAGRLIREKNVNILINALNILCNQIPDLKVVIVGDGPERNSLRRMVHNYKLEKYITFTGFLNNPDEVIALMKSSKVFVSPSIREGFGIASLEAMACGIPVVTVDHPQNAITELVTPETGVITFSFPITISSAIQACLQDKSRFKIPCQTKAKDYDWEPIVDKIERYYNSVQR
ncbi:MAG: glycosyltransferase family 4 protein [Thermoplasmata archaeon]|nr:glycosyltransferase family 4 protein [Thermoplasmata archaeon]